MTYSCDVFVLQAVCYGENVPHVTVEVAALTCVLPLLQAVCYGEDVRYVAAEIEGLTGLYVISAAAAESLSQTLGRRVTAVRQLAGEQLS